MVNCYFLALLLAFSAESISEVGSFSAHYTESISNCANIEKHNLVLYYTTYCPYSQKVLKYLNKIHKQLPMKNLANDPLAKEELKKVGGKMQVPCLVIDGTAMYESNEIIHWLSLHQDELKSINN